MKFVNLSNHASVKLSPLAPWVLGENPKTGREIKIADLSQCGTIEEYLKLYTVAKIEPNDGSYANPIVKQLEASVQEEVLEDGTIITHNVGGKTVVEGLPQPTEGVIYLTSFVTAQAAQRADVVSPNTIADPATGFAIGAIGYIAFG